MSHVVFHFYLINDALHWGHGIRGGFEKGNLCFGNLEDARTIELPGEGTLQTVKYVNHQLEEKWGLGSMGLQWECGEKETQRHQKEGQGSARKVSQGSSKETEVKMSPLWKRDQFRSEVNFPGKDSLLNRTQLVLISGVEREAHTRTEGPGQSVMERRGEGGHGIKVGFLTASWLLG